MEKHTILTATISAVAGAVVGGVITYVATNKALVHRYEDWANEEINDVKARYAALNSEQKMSFVEMASNPPAEIMAAVERGKALLKEQGYTLADEVDVSAQTLSIFDRATEVDGEGNPVEEDSDEEDDSEDDGYERIEGEPFLITEEAYFENEQEYELDTLTYYGLDDTLTDEKNAQIDRVQETIGERHLHMFKAGGDKTSLYIQNDEHQTLYEVILVNQSYAVTILGMTEEELGLKEPKKRPGKMPKDRD